MSEVIMKMSDVALSDWESQVTGQGGTATLNKWREYEFNGEIFYSYADCYPQEGGTWWLEGIPERILWWLLVDQVEYTLGWKRVLSVLMFCNP